MFDCVRMLDMIQSENGCERVCVGEVCVGGWVADFFAVVNAYFECFSLYMLECILIIL